MMWLRKQRARISPKSRLGEKLAYIGNHWDGLEAFLSGWRVEMDNNVAYSVNGINDDVHSSDNSAANRVIVGENLVAFARNGHYPHKGRKRLALILPGYSIKTPSDGSVFHYRTGASAPRMVPRTPRWPKTPSR